MHEELLREIGLTGGEARVYLALIKLGENTVGPIAKDAGVSLSKIYEILDHLIKKGLVSYIVKNDTKYFLATEPERIIDYLENKKQEIDRSEQAIKKILPLLKVKKEEQEITAKATLFEGFRGVKTFYESILRDSKQGEEIFVMGLPRYAAEKYEGYFLDWNERRFKKGIKIKLIFEDYSREFGKKREKIGLTDIKYLPKGIVTPAWILITQRGVATIHLAKDPICVYIKDKDARKSYENFFKVFWNLAEK